MIRPMPRSASPAPLTAFLLLAAILFLTACATDTRAPVRTGPAPSVTETPPVQEPLERRAVAPPHMQGREPVRIALLLPLSGAAPEVTELARSLHDAAQLALFQINNPDLLLLPKDTGATIEGAERAAEEALSEGAELILGPLFAGQVQAIAPLATLNGVPVVSFSSDSAVAGNGVYILSFPAEAEVERVTRYAVTQGYSRFAALIPTGAYGERVREALVKNALANGVSVVDVVAYQPGAPDFLEPVRSLAIGHTEGFSPFDTVLIPEGGTTVRGLAPLLPYFDIDNREVKFLGTGLWDDPSLWREPALIGGWFAAPDPTKRAAFSARFREVWGYHPQRISTLAFDAVTLAAALASDAPAGARYTPQRIASPDGFLGLDGIFRFGPDGVIERGLSVLEIVEGDVITIDPAPASFTPPTATLGF